MYWYVSYILLNRRETQPIGLYANRLLNIQSLQWRRWRQARTYIKKYFSAAYISAANLFVNLCAGKSICSSCAGHWHHLRHCHSPFFLYDIVFIHYYYYYYYPWLCDARRDRLTIYLFFFIQGFHCEQLNRFANESFIMHCSF